MSSTMTADLARLTVELPKPIKDWLERKGLDRKQRGLQRHSGVAPVLVEICEREMAREETTAEPAPKRRKARGDDPEDKP